MAGLRQHHQVFIHLKCWLGSLLVSSTLQASLRKMMEHHTEQLEEAMGSGSACLAVPNTVTKAYSGCRNYPRGARGWIQVVI